MCVFFKTLVNGAWGAWSKAALGECSENCGPGTRTVTKTRLCDSPAPSNGGETCPGKNKEVKEEACNLKTCRGN